MLSQNRRFLRADQRQARFSSRFYEKHYRGRISPPLYWATMALEGGDGPMALS